MHRLPSKYQSGFTLVELVTVIIILGILAVGMGNFLQFGSRIFTETSARDQLVSSARFAIERLNREVRHAVPNSVKEVNANGNCLSFYPTIASTVYIDIPVSPEADNDEITIIPFDDNTVALANNVIVYPLMATDFEPSVNTKYHPFTLPIDKTATPWVLSFSSPVSFANDSPTQRIFFYGDEVSYCVVGTQLIRSASGNSSVMADDILNYYSTNNMAAFKVTEATQTRNATIQVRLQFGVNGEESGEQVTFNNEIQVPNVP
ncbi:type II secretion system protein [Colwellia sp. 1_MG-2023]|uniref:PilW family protein n=1 Tax=Colwellia sp. 1_MG-2023 TaxID=3062649 RepID=UPI0026E3AFF5|nr:type II secretion system protein [Colwellia sp. 1_MG-2023]MDO6444732.1 type II secretion system protein [Colwellia sp. 1_MG-2023]